MQKYINQTYAFAMKYHESDKTGHGFDHIERVFKIAQDLLKSCSNTDSFVVQMAALLHDVDDHKLGSDGTIAARFLGELGLPTDISKRILETINAIGFSKSGNNPNFDTPEQQLLSDADKLDALGCIGVIRTLQFSMFQNRPIFDADQFPADPLTPEIYKDMTRKTNTFINHFFDKLLKLKNAMQTSVGKKEAQRRHDFMVFFLEQFFEESHEKEWQDYLSDYLKKHSF